jgi:dihydroorotase
MRILIKAAKIVDPGSPYNGLEKDILIENGIISSIGDALADAETTLQARGLFLSPGWLDMQANFCDPGFEQKEDFDTGTAAAAQGGFTHVCLLPNTQPVVQSKNALSYISRGNSYRLVQLLPLAAVTLNTKGEELTEMLDLHHAGAVAFSDGIEPIWNADILLKSLQYLQTTGAVLITRPEDKMLTRFANMHEGQVSTRLGFKGMPALAEELIIDRDIEILKYTGGRLHFSNISCEGAVKRIRAAKSLGLSITCDVAAHQLAFTDDSLATFDTNFKVNPPLRQDAHRNALIDGLKDGTIDVVVSSHQPQDVEAKNLEFDMAEFGAIGLQSVFPILNQVFGDENHQLIAEKIAINPRKILGLPIPVINEGQSADLTLFDPKAKWTLNKLSNKSKSENSPFWGQELTGKSVGLIRGTFSYLPIAK